MKNSLVDVAVIGAGAAGLMTSIFCRRNGLDVLILDGQEKIGAKILMSGGTRCNLTNLDVTEKDYQSGQIRVVRNVLRAFSSRRAVDFFNRLGVELVLEPGGKFFPKTHSAKTVLDALLGEVKKRNIRLETARKVRSVDFKEGRFIITGDDFQYFSKTLVLSTGGLSYPTTGSDGSGYEIAKSFGHHIISTTPALTPLRTNDRDWTSLSGISLPCELTLYADRKKFISYRDSFLFTHFGFSGPSVLDMSRHWVRLKNAHDVQLFANFLPDANPSALDEEIICAGKQRARQKIKSFLSDKLPERFAETVLKKSKINTDTMLNQLRREDRERLIRNLLHMSLSPTDVFGYKKAEVTAGGVDLSEVDSRTLESRLRPGLIFAGEILDVDGRIGGFNFQWAWSSGVAASRAVMERLNQLKNIA